MNRLAQKANLIRRCEQSRLALGRDIRALRLSLSWTDKVKDFGRNLVRAWPVAPALILALIARGKTSRRTALPRKLLSSLGIVPLLLRWWLRRGINN